MAIGIYDSTRMQLTKCTPQFLTKLRRTILAYVLCYVFAYLEYC